MKAITDEFRIGHGIPDDKGQPLEPEEQPVDHVLGTMLPVTLGNAPGEGTPIETPMRGRVTVESTAGEMAAELTEQCYLCAHWDPVLFRAERRTYDAREQDRQRAIAVEVSGPEALDIILRARADAILDASFGRCRALSHYSPDGRLDTFARAYCPSATMDGTPIPKAFTAHADARRDAVQIRDKILLTASGRGAT